MRKNTGPNNTEKSIDVSQGRFTGSTDNYQVGRSTSSRSLLFDYKNILRLAYPVILSNAVDTVMMMVDRLFLSRLNLGAGSEVMLGGALGGGVITWLMQAPLLGLLMYTNAMASQSFGRSDLPRCAQITCQAMYWALVYYPIMLIISRSIPAILVWMAHDPALAAAEWDYASIIVGGAIFSLLRIPLSNFFIASNRSNLVMKVSFASLLINIPLNYWFIFDIPISLSAFFPPILGFGSSLGDWNLRPSDLGIPNGIAGAAAATVAAQFLACVILLLLFLRQKGVYKVATAWGLRLDIHRELLCFGLPATFESFLASFSFNVFLMLFNSISPMVAAAGTITFSWDLCNFIVLMGIGTATTTLVGQNLGAGNLTQAKHYTRLILAGSLSFSGFVSLWFLLAPDLLSGVFITEAAVDQQALLAMSRSMLRLTTFYLLADSLGVVMRGALNGAGDTFVVMVISATMHLLLLFGAILALKVFHLGAIGLWRFFVIFVLFINGAFAFRYFRGRWAKRWNG